jgi:hypothetical protein
MIGFTFFDNFSTKTSTNNKTKITNQLWSHQAANLSIRSSVGGNPFVGSKNDTSPPNPPLSQVAIQTIMPGTSIQYKAYVIWSDDSTLAAGVKNPFGRGTREDWTNDLYWEGDDLVSGSPGLFRFNTRGLGDFHTIKVSFSDPTADFIPSLSVTGKDAWEFVYAVLSVYLDDNCANGTYVVIFGCGAPKTQWQTYGLASGNYIAQSPWYDSATGRKNLLPPALASIYGFPYGWGDPYYPYFLHYDFPVTGTSVGTGER